MGEKVLFTTTTIEVQGVGEVELVIQPVTSGNAWETSGDAMRVAPIDYQVADVFLATPEGLKD